MALVFSQSREMFASFCLKVPGMGPTLHSWYLGVTHALRYTVSPTFKFVHHSIAGLGVATFCSMHVCHNQLIPSMFDDLDIFFLCDDAIVRL
jgi:hypothetical protein